MWEEEEDRVRGVDVKYYIWFVSEEVWFSGLVLVGGLGGIWEGREGTDLMVW